MKDLRWLVSVMQALSGVGLMAFAPFAPKHEVSSFVLMGLVLLVASDVSEIKLKLDEK